MADMRYEDKEAFEKYCYDPQFVHIVPNMLLKKIITPGNAQDQFPSANAKVQVHYTGTLLDGTEFDSSRKRGEPFEFTIGLSQVIKAWDQGVATMCCGERCLLVLHPSYGYGENGSPPTIPGGAALQFDIEALDYCVEDHEYPETLEQRRDAANIRQERARQYFAYNKYKRSLASYEKAIELIDEDQSTESVKNRGKWLSNTCLCYYKLGQLEKCIKDGQKAIEVLKTLPDEEDVLQKTYKRVIRAQVDLKQFEAVVSLENDSQIAQKIKVMIAPDIQRAKDKLLEAAKQRNDMYRKMMSYRAGAQ